MSECKFGPKKKTILTYRKWEPGRGVLSTLIFITCSFLCVGKLRGCIPSYELQMHSEVEQPKHRFITPEKIKPYLLMLCAT